MTIYVTMTDRVMSRMYPKKRISKLVFVCADRAEADIVERNALNRDDMIRVSMVEKKPRYPTATHHTTFMTRGDAGRMYRAGGF